MGITCRNKILLVIPGIMTGGVIVDELQARTIIETICKGIDPLTGYDLHPADVCSSSTVQAALRLLLDNCTIPSTDEYYKQLYEENQKRKAAIKADSKIIAAKADKLRKSTKRNMRTIPHYDSRPWSDEDNADLLLLAEKYTAEQLAAILGRDKKTVVLRLKHLDHNTPPVPKGGRSSNIKKPENSGKQWSKVDDKILIEMYHSSHSNQEICEYFKRTETAIAARLVRLRIIGKRNEFRHRGSSS